MRRCRFCGCSDNDACPNICSWSAEDLCSTCATFKDEMEQYVKNCRRVTKVSLLRMHDEILAES